MQISDSWEWMLQDKAAVKLKSKSGDDNNTTHINFQLPINREKDAQTSFAVSLLPVLNHSTDLHNYSP